jgi:FkbM family methyltransferase
MNLHTSFILFIFDLINKYYHLNRIHFFLKKKKIKIFTYFDIGAHLGSFADMILSMNPNCKCTLFEPQKVIYKKIKTKYSKLEQMQIFNYGVSEKKEIKKFFLNKHNLTSSFESFNKNDNYLNFKAKLFGTELKNMIYKTEMNKTIALEEFINKKKIKEINLMKIDVEGHELKVLKGLKNKLNLINNIIIEYHLSKIYDNYNALEIHNYLLNRGFSLIKIFKFPFLSWQDRFYSKEN